MNNTEIVNYEQHTKLKSCGLMLLFIIANLIFGNSVLSGFCIMALAMKIASCAFQFFFDEMVQYTVGFWVFVIIWQIYLWLKFNCFKIIYQKAKVLGESTILYKFLNVFLYNPKVKILVLFLALLFDYIVMVLSNKKPLVQVSWIISNVLLIGGVTPCYIAFALIGRDRNRIN